ncbi:LysR family transcriptional regulator [Aliivibrio fischeri]|uniref:LysR family transcriptional regulator n=1 Tax=Aliivibrio fischeri TaxID=668 RepID=UPI0012D8AF1F|nr:LysR family transcriptional regulator [Aliivibrio fischeri]MUK61801.1 LysR family transcriptional regulator [Aliivibrio fischeri]MUK69233.1 LysR family transcriptional regulator [Aliivibrio fischeri]MUK71731.1 LysR family transcriptional regulator [Aliivibrio fischeri]MUL21928.1 LysR family transcriptional regulator [Aliivibrio fischeri]MUL25857.1 LysR family transcriptional regulator [Aliivibrio fischeri]
MDLIQLSRISFKHLTALHTMLSTHSVTKSAEVLCMSPSSVSKTLTQLRIVLDDELFYRDGTQLIPTSYALKIGPTVHLILNNMNGLLNQSTFDPALFSGCFSLSMRESTLEVFAPVMSDILSNQATNAQVNVHSKEQLGFDALLNGQVDLIILPHDKSQPPTNEKQLVWESIIEDEMVCLMREDHPLAKDELTIEDYLSYKHIGIFDKELDKPYFEQLLTQQHQSRTMAMFVADFGSAAAMCQHSDFLFTSSKKWFEVTKQAHGLIQKPLPFDYGQVAYSMVYNKLSQNDQALSWLLNRIKEQVNNTKD